MAPRSPPDGVDPGQHCAHGQREHRHQPVPDPTAGRDRHLLQHGHQIGLRWTSLYDCFTSDYLPGSDRRRKEDL